jgi:hypothetical protein
MDISKLKGVNVGNAGGYCMELGNSFQENGETEICIFLKDIKTNVKDIKYMPYIAHEIMHAIQIMCKNYAMDITKEEEHTAYIMFYLLEEVTK